MSYQTKITNGNGNEPNENITTSKQASNNNDKIGNLVFNVMTSLVILGSTYLYYYMPDYIQQLYEKYPDYKFPEYSDFLIAFAFMPLFVVLREITNKCTKKLATAMIGKKFKDPSDLENFNIGKVYIKKQSCNFYKVVFYIFNVIFGYIVLKDLNYFPVYFGGSGEFKNIYANGKIDMTFYKPPLFTVYYMFYLSHNLTDMIYLLFIYEQQTDFPLMFLHHTCTISLIFFSHFTNLSHIGAIVMFLHDIADIVVYYMRSIINTDCGEFQKVSGGIILLLIYIYTRLFVFGKLIYSCYDNLSNMMDQTLWYFMCFLYVIHSYWLLQIVKKIYNGMFKREFDDTASFKKQIKNVD